MIGNSFRKLTSLVVLTTTDSSLVLMREFGHDLQSFAKTSGVSVLWRVVDGLHFFSSAPADIVDQLEALDVDWQKPAFRMSQEAAITSGLMMSRGYPTLLMAPDMVRNIPDIAEFVKRYESGYEVVAGWRVRRVGVSTVRQQLTRLFNLMPRVLFDLPVRDFNTGMALLGDKAIERMYNTPPDCPSPALYVACEFRASLAEVPITVVEIAGRKSTYTFLARLRIGFFRVREVLMFRKWYSRRTQ